MFAKNSKSKIETCNYLFKTIVIVSSVFVLACATTSRKPRSVEPDALQVESRDVDVQAKNTDDYKHFVEIDEQYRSRNIDRVLASSQTFQKRYPKSEYLDHVYNLRALAFIETKQYSAALINFKKVHETSQSPVINNLTWYNQGYCYYMMKQYDQAYESLSNVQVLELSKDNRVKFYILRAKTLRNRQDYARSAYDMFLAIKNISDTRDTGVLTPLMQFLDEALIHIADISALEQMLSEFDDSPAADRLYFRLGEHYFQAGARSQAKTYFDKIVSNYKDSRYYLQSLDYSERLQHQEKVAPNSVGVLLSLSGKFAKYGYSVLQAIELASKTFSSASEGGDVPTASAKITLVIADDKGEEESALKALDELFFKHHVIAVIGPLSSKLAEPVGKRAQELGLPLISLTQKEILGKDYVFNSGLTPATQVHALVEYAVKKAGYKNFAILAPSSRFGEEYIKNFWDELDQYGGQVRGFEVYPDDETDFRQYIDRIVGLAQTEARATEVNKLKALRAASPIKGRSKRLDQLFSLKPVVDFDAVFIPDEPRILGQILPTFAYRDVEKTTFLGINTWNSTELIARAGQFVEGAVFVDGFYAESKNPKSQTFLQEYRQTYSLNPGLIEASGYDAAKIVFHIIQTENVKSRSAMRSEIASLSDFSGVTGKISSKNGRLTKELNLLSIKGGKIVEIAF